MADKKIDPYNIDALEKSLNDSATRVSAIWLSFILFGLYLVISIGTVTQRQILLEDPVKLPVLNVDLPLVGFFFLAPTIFVVFHAYLLLQVVLLGRTAAAYNQALERSVQHDTDSAQVRQRLANTLFAQLFAGSRRERKGLIGALLTVLAWITLAIGPLLVLLYFQFGFLPYHSHIVTWLHRILILIELVLIFSLWPLALRPDRDFSGHRFLANPLVYVSLVLVGYVSVVTFTFPGEPHISYLISKDGFGPQQCEQTSNDWRHALFGPFDRLSLPTVDIVDDEKFAKIEKAVADRGMKPSEGDRTRDFRRRNFNCSDFSGGDLRRADFTDAKAIGANWTRADLQGASLDGLNGLGMFLFNAKLQHASLREAILRHARLNSAELVGADLFRTELIAAILWDAALQGSRLVDANLTGAMLLGANFTGARLDGSTLGCVVGQGAVFHGASLRGAKLQGSVFLRSHFAGANLFKAELQYSNFWESDFDSARLIGVFAGKAGGANCHGARVEKLDRTIPDVIDGTDREQSIDAFWQACSALETHTRMVLEGSFLRRDVDAASFGADCEADSATHQPHDHDKKHIAILLEFACSSNPAIRSEILRAIIANWLSRSNLEWWWYISNSRQPELDNYEKELALGIVERNSCGLAKLLDERELYELRAKAASKASAPTLSESVEPL